MMISKNLSLSLIMHALLLFILVYSIKTPTPGTTTQNVMHAFIYEAPPQKVTPRIEKPAKKTPPKKISVHGIIKNPLKIIHEKKEAIRASIPPDSAYQEHKGKETTRLIALLHDAIQKKQNYPDSAFAMGRQGRVTVSFILLTDGNIADLHLITGSGTESLDRAALTAVVNAAPFQQVLQMITKAQEYQIDIIFELT